MVQNFGLEIPALTQARATAEKAGYNQHSRKVFEEARAETSELRQQVANFLEDHDAIVVADGSHNKFGVITSEEDPEAPCGVPFQGSIELAQAVAKRFPDYTVLSRDGEVIEPLPATVSSLDEARRKRRLRPTA